MDGPESGHQATATRPTLPDDHAVAPLSEVDPEIGGVLERERERQRNTLEMIAEWGRVTVAWWTHKIGGLHLNDFVMAARTDELYGASRNETSA